MQRIRKVKRKMTGIDKELAYGERDTCIAQDVARLYVTGRENGAVVAGSH